MATRKLGRIESAVVRCAREANLPATDKAGILAAQALARALDDNPTDFEIVKLAAPRLVTALNALGLTNAGRVVKGKAAAGEVTNGDRKKPANVIQLLRSQHRAG